ncbi:MAG: hypothetical protein ABI894_14995 [Ilumatobacteraceae bacterium]
MRSEHEVASVIVELGETVLDHVEAGTDVAEQALPDLGEGAAVR